MNRQHSRIDLGIFLLVAVATIGLTVAGCKKPESSEPAKTPPVSKPPVPMTELKTPEAKPPLAATPKPSIASATNSPTKALVFRNVRSWNRKVDFEDVLTDLGMTFDVRASADMESTDLSPYGFVIIPGAQWQNDFYLDYAANAARFE